MGCRLTRPQSRCQSDAAGLHHPKSLSALMLDVMHSNPRGSAVFREVNMGEYGDGR